MVPVIIFIFGFLDTVGGIFVDWRRCIRTSFVDRYESSDCRWNLGMWHPAYTDFHSRFGRSGQAPPSHAIFCKYLFG